MNCIKGKGCCRIISIRLHFLHYLRLHLITHKKLYVATTRFHLECFYSTIPLLSQRNWIRASNETTSWSKISMLVTLSFFWKSLNEVVEKCFPYVKSLLYTFTKIETQNYVKKLHKKKLRFKVELFKVWNWRFFQSLTEAF